MGALLGDGLANFVFTLTSIFLLTRYSLAARLTEGLWVFHAHSAEDQNTEKAKGNSKAARWLNKSAVRQKVYSEGAEQAVRVSLPLGATSKSPFYDDVELLVNVAVILVGNAAICATPLPEVKLASMSWLICLAMAAPIVVLTLLAKAEVFTEMANKKDKSYVWTASLLASGIAFAVTFLPSSVLDFDWESAAEDLSQYIMRTRQRMHISPETVDSLQIPDIALRAVLAIQAGFLVGAVLPGVIRVARSYMLAAQPGPATAQYIGVSNFQLLRMQAALTLPFFAGLAWIRPLAQDCLGVSDDVVDAARACLLLSAAAAGFLAIRPLLRGYLSSGLLVWWTYKHAITSWDKSTKIGDLIQMRVKNINALICKVTLELLAPSILWAAYGCLLVYTAISSEDVPGYNRLVGGLKSLARSSSGISLSAESHDSSKQTIPYIFLGNAVGFVASFTSLCWSASLSIFIALFRTGMLPEV